uniref:Plastid-encoded RNA polymerase subunit alpha n=1 Tax=Chlamydomonas applanata TaxID=35704 RepID=A0A0S2LPT9_CHLAP|nr:alpha subunit of RNA polymerase [Chlamydomonas applanata]
MTKLFISCKESRIENNRSFYGCFYLGPFESGQSLTIANALRRTLLAECSGLGIVSVLIENVHHEYSTLPGVRDSVLDILLNMKEIVLKKTKNVYGMYKKKSVHSVYEGIGSTYFKPVIGYLKVRGPGVIRAKDLRLPPSVECVDPNQYIATVGNDGFLNMKFIIMEGKNNILGNVTRDADLLNQRQKLVNELKRLMNGSDQVDSVKGPSLDLIQKTPTSITSESPHPAARAKKGGHKGETTTTAVKKTGLKKVDEVYSVSNPKNETKQEENIVEHTNVLNDNIYQNSTQLFLDAIFNPVTKVNYVVEVNENKLVEKESKKYTLTEDITHLMQSTNELQNAFPFLYNAKDNQESPNPVSFSENQNRMIEFVDHFFPSSYSGTSLSSEEPSSKHDFMNLYSCIQPLKKEKPTNTIILEIWTNGSLHPREALRTSFNHLANSFLLLQKTKPINTIYNDWSSYKNVLNSFTKDSPKVSKSVEYNPAPPSPKAPEGKNQAEESLQTLGVTNRDSVASMNLKGLKNFNISTLNISLRTYTKLKLEKINTIGELTLKWKEISEKFDKKTTNELLKCLSELL